MGQMRQDFRMPYLHGAYCIQCAIYGSAWISLSIHNAVTAVTHSVLSISWDPKRVANDVHTVSAVITNLKITPRGWIQWHKVQLEASDNWSRVRIGLILLNIFLDELDDEAESTLSKFGKVG